jgi:hypothetical protein
MRARHAALLATIRELLALGSPPFEVPLDDFAFSTRSSQLISRRIDVTLQLCVCDCAAIFVGERKLQLVATTGNESVGGCERRARCSRH